MAVRDKCRVCVIIIIEIRAKILEDSTTDNQGVLYFIYIVPS